MPKGVAGMNWFRCYADLPEHPKSLRLCAVLGADNAHVYPFNIWCWATRQAPDGEIQANDHQALRQLIERVANWRGEPGKLFRALLDVGFLDGFGRPVRRVLVHDWELINGAHKRAAEKSAARSKALRTARKTKQNHARDPNSEVPELVDEKSEERVTQREPNAHESSPRVENGGGKEERERAPRSLSLVGAPKKPVVVGRRKKKTFSNFSTTTSRPEVGWIDPSVLVFEALLEGLRGAGKRYIAEQAQLRCWPLRIEANDLHLGVEDEFARTWCDSNLLLHALAVLEQTEGRGMGISISVSERPPAPPSWTLSQCLQALEQAGLAAIPRPTDDNLEAFWADAQHVPPAELLAGAQLFRADPYWAKDQWGLFRFVCEGVWKTRVSRESALTAAQRRP